MARIDNNDMTDMQREKNLFVMDKLDPMLYQATGGVVRYAGYRAYTSGEEAVALQVGSRMADGRFHEVLVNVTGDSLWAIVKDVAKAVERIYG